MSDGQSEAQERKVQGVVFHYIPIDHSIYLSSEMNKMMIKMFL